MSIAIDHVISIALDSKFADRVEAQDDLSHPSATCPSWSRKVRMIGEQSHGGMGSRARGPGKKELQD